MAIFNGATLIITLDAPTGGLLDVDVQDDLYEPWKLFMLTSTNRGFPPAFSTLGGVPIGATNTGAYFPIRNDLGWRIQSTDEDQNINYIGNLVATDPALAIVTPTPGRTVLHLGLQPVVEGIVAVALNVLLSRELLESDQVFDQSAGLLHYYRKGTLVDLIPAKTVVTTQTQDTSLVE